MTIVSELHQDHVNLSKLLAILDKKVLKLKEGTYPNFSLMADVIGYIANYAEQHHHPREDQMYHYFSGRDAALDAAMTECIQAHDNLKGDGQSLLEFIDGIMHDAVLPMEQFIQRLETFVTNEKNHMDFEEGKIFPLINDVASQEDWEILAEKLPAESDPLFGEKQAQEYMALYQELMRDIAA